MTIRNSKFEVVFIALIALGLIFYLFGYKNKTSDKETKTENGKIGDIQKEIETESIDNTAQENKNIETKSLGEGEDIPDKILIKVPFTSQAPFAKWDEFHEEACEEASLIMIKYYFDEKVLSKEMAEKEIQDMIKFEIKKYGDYKDTNVEKTAKLAKDYYGINNLKVIYDFKPEDIKKYLAKGKPIIVPAAGRLLGNPNFTPPGPLYHNLVLIGYEGNIIVSNDPGTKRGEGYKYNINTLYKAIHDFPGKKDEIEKGRKAMIIIE